MSISIQTTTQPVKQPKSFNDWQHSLQKELDKMRNTNLAKKFKK